MLSSGTSERGVEQLVNEVLPRYHLVTALGGVRNYSLSDRHRLGDQKRSSRLDVIHREDPSAVCVDRLTGNRPMCPRITAKVLQNRSLWTAAERGIAIREHVEGVTDTGSPRRARVSVRWTRSREWGKGRDRLSNRRRLERIYDEGAYDDVVPPFLHEHQLRRAALQLLQDCSESSSRPAVAMAAREIWFGWCRMAIRPGPGTTRSD